MANSPTDPGKPWWANSLAAAGVNPSNVVALPEMVEGSLMGASDDIGQQVMADISLHVILSAIYALGKEIRTVSETQGQMIDAVTAKLTTHNADMKAALVEIGTRMAALEAGAPASPLSQATIDALSAAEVGTAENTLVAQGLASPPPPPPPAPVAEPIPAA